MSPNKVRLGLGASAFLATLGLLGCGGSGSTGTTTGSTSSMLPGFTVTNLVSDQAGKAALTDPNLVNPWGIAFSASGPWWISDNNSNLASIYSGGKVGGSITNLSPGGIQIPFGTPTGQVFNGTTDFQVTNGTTAAPAAFIFSSESGWIDGWNPSVNAGAAEAPGDFSALGSVFKGLAIGSNSTGNFIYATDFANAKVMVLDKNFAPATLDGSFTDPTIPAGFAPFGIQNIGGTLYVTYAKQDAAKHDDTPGKGNGYINAFDTDGHLIKRIASKGNLNSPWGLTLAPTFGSVSNMLIVGNFGDGKINAFNLTDDTYVGTFADASGKAVVIDGLWGLSFGNGGSAGDSTSLYFTAGPAGESHGLLGRINAPLTPIAKPRRAR